MSAYVRLIYASCVTLAIAHCNAHAASDEPVASLREAVGIVMFVHNNLDLMLETCKKVAPDAAAQFDSQAKTWRAQSAIAIESGSRQYRRLMAEDAKFRDAMTLLDRSFRSDVTRDSSASPGTLRRECEQQLAQMADGTHRRMYRSAYETLERSK
jgi:hypothetical protein